MLYIYTFYTDESRIQNLKKSSQFTNTTIHYLKKEYWGGYVDKITTIDNIIKSHKDEDIIGFIDAYDVITNQNEEYILEKFHSYNCDLLLGGELNCFPSKYQEFYPKNSISNYKYVNSGGYIGYKKALQELFNWIPYDEIHRICRDGGDQSFFKEYYIFNHNNKNVKIDSKCLIFQNMHFVDWNEMSIINGKIYNKIMDTYPCFIHFNGGTWKQENSEDITPILIEPLTTIILLMI
jgi:hypothetical protein